MIGGGLIKERIYSLFGFLFYNFAKNLDDHVNHWYCGRIRIG